MDDMHSATKPLDPQTAELLVVGSAERRAHLQQAMHELAPLLRGVERVDAPGAHVVPHTVAVILLNGGHDGWAQEIERLRGELGSARKLPIVVVADPGSDSDHVRAAYRAGATAVLEWPTEVLLVHDLLLELVELPGVTPSGAGGDVALTEAVAARLRLDPVLAERASCRVIGATAVVRGELRSAWERDRLVRLVEAVPGINHVVDHGIELRTRTVPDDELDRTVASVVRSTGNVEARALETRVESGVVTLTGSSDAAAALRVGNALRAIPGVRRVDDASTRAQS